MIIVIAQNKNEYDLTKMEKHLDASINRNE